MSRFRFRFAVVLKARERTRDAARATLAEALRNAADAAAAQRAVQTEIEQQRTALAAATAGGRADAADWIARLRHGSSLTVQRQTADAAVADAATAVATARTSLVAADRDVAALETLRDRDRLGHRTAALAAEQRTAEDLFTAASAATRRGASPAH